MPPSTSLNVDSAAKSINAGPVHFDFEPKEPWITSPILNPRKRGSRLTTYRNVMIGINASIRLTNASAYLVSIRKRQGNGWSNPINRDIRMMLGWPAGEMNSFKPQTVVPLDFF